ncbi:MAG: hypothetical protein ACM3ZE_17590, partial [Myxococcales bacterium]
MNSPQPVLAQTTVHATGVVGIGYTDNLFAGPGTAGNQAPRRTSTSYLNLTPGLAVYHSRELSRFFLAYTHPVFVYL